MAPNPKVSKAFRAMKDIGISEDKTKPVLKKLLKLYEKNWELIEEENYRVLADAIFDEDDNKAVEEEKKVKNPREEDFGEDIQAPDESVRPLKRLRLRGQEAQVSPFQNSTIAGLDETPLIIPKLEEGGFPETHPPQQLQLCAPKRSENDPSSSRRADKGKEPVSPNMVARVKKSNMEKPSTALRIKEPAVVSGVKNKKVRASGAHTLIVPKDEPFTDDISTTVLPPCQLSVATTHPDPSSKGDCAVGNNSVGKPDSQDGQASHRLNGSNKVDSTGTTQYKKSASSELATVLEESPSNLEIASSPLGEEGSMNRMPLLDVMNNSDPKDSLDVVANEGNTNLPTSMNEPVSITSDRLPAPHVPSISQSLSICDDQTINRISISSKDISNGHSENEEGKEHDPLEATETHNMMVVSQCQQAPDELSFSHDANDITKGEERVQVKWVNEINEEHPPFFQYIPHSLIFQRAFVNLSLSLIGKDNCCQSCFGNCLTLSSPCACSRETGAKFVYTSEGLVKEDFLEEWISLARDPQRNHQFYCKECPLERSKNDDCLEPCKGHLERKLIKECWSKCGCSKQCGNRVVQRGITCNLQVFFTSEGKGWGLRTLEELPKGSFVCEYAGEILTISEMYHRKVQSTKTGEYTNPVLLDAFWNSEGSLKDEKTLCLDATYFANVARFVNHRCFDANLVDVAVEVETPDHHYYHVALFTTRKIDAMEELTWDYGIDFDDLDQSVKPFQCQCGSKFCRNMKRSSRSRSASSTR